MEDNRGASANTIPRTRAQALSAFRPREVMNKMAAAAVRTNDATAAPVNTHPAALPANEKPWASKVAPAVSPSMIELPVGGPEVAFGDAEK